MDYVKLAQAAIGAARRAYAPYSNFLVGAALLGESGRVYSGCNIENASFSATNCAERTALFKAVSDGERKFLAIAIAGGVGGEPQYCYPCGVCRQVLAEFFSAETEIIVVKSATDFEICKFGELLPHPFGSGNLS